MINHAQRVKPVTNVKPIVEQATHLLELVFDEALRRACERCQLPNETEQDSLWVEGAQAADILGAGYSLPRLKQLGHAGELIMDRKDPDKPNSPYIFLRSSLHSYSAKRVFELNEQMPIKAITPRAKPWNKA